MNTEQKTELAHHIRVQLTTCNVREFLRNAILPILVNSLSFQKWQKAQI